MATLQAPGEAFVHGQPRLLRTPRVGQGGDDSAQAGVREVSNRWHRMPCRMQEPAERSSIEAEQLLKDHGEPRRMRPITRSPVRTPGRRRHQVRRVVADACSISPTPPTPPTWWATRPRTSSPVHVDAVHHRTTGTLQADRRRIRHQGRPRPHSEKQRWPRRYTGHAVQHFSPLSSQYSSTTSTTRRTARPRRRTHHQHRADREAPGDQHAHLGHRQPASTVASRPRRSRGSTTAWMP